jgi:hypothetical protein
VSGLNLVESDALLDELSAHATAPRFMWSVGADPILTTCADPKLTRGFC